MIETGCVPGGSQRCTRVFQTRSTRTRIEPLSQQPRLSLYPSSIIRSGDMSRCGVVAIVEIPGLDPPRVSGSLQLRETVFFNKFRSVSARPHRWHHRRTSQQHRAAQTIAMKHCTTCTPVSFRSGCVRLSVRFDSGKNDHFMPQAYQCPHLAPAQYRLWWLSCLARPTALLQLERIDKRVDYAASDLGRGGGSSALAPPPRRREAARRRIHSPVLVRTSLQGLLPSRQKR